MLRKRWLLVAVCGVALCLIGALVVRTSVAAVTVVTPAPTKAQSPVTPGITTNVDDSISVHQHLNMTAHFSIWVSHGRPAGQTVTVHYHTRPGTTSSFTPTSGTVVFKYGQAAYQIIHVPVQYDASLAHNGGNPKNFYMDIDSPTPNSVTLGRSEGVCTVYAD